MTDTKTLTRPPQDQSPEPKNRLLEMSATQLVGGALAAMTAAVIGAQLGVAGTVFGAAIGSIVAGAAGSLYTASLKHGKDRLASAFVGRVGDTDVELTTVPTDSTEINGWATITEPAAAVAPPSPAPVATAAEVDGSGRSVSRWPWKPILVSTAAVFLLAIAGITGFELVSGQSVSGGDGTTITQVSEGRSSGTDTPTQAPSTDTSTEPTSESVAPSTETSTAPSSDPSQAVEPTTEPSESTTPSASTDPASSASPSVGSEQVGGSDTSGG